MPVLAEIVAAARSTLPAIRVRSEALERVIATLSAPADFAGALRGANVALIAEVKRRSPSAGAINEALDPATLATAYVKGGANAISVLTDGPFFGGSMRDLVDVTASVRAPVMRKDFILDESQILEARAGGASAVLLIVRVLEQAELLRLHRFAVDLQLSVLVETHNREEVSRALDAGAAIVGVNARDLDDFTVNTGKAWEILASIPSHVTAVAESGMATRHDVDLAAAAGADAVLIGSALAKSGNPEAGTRAVVEVVRRGR